MCWLFYYHFWFRFDMQKFCRYNNLKLFIFSDDKNFRFKKWKNNNKKVYVNYLELNTFEDFELMRMCKYHIISNSTFSWWSSFLSESRNSDIILPNRWRNDDLNCEDMYVGDMIRLWGGTWTDLLKILFSQSQKRYIF